MTQVHALGLADCVEAIESSYEFLLAYAAQGRSVESAGGDGPPVRDQLRRMATGLAAVGAAADAALRDMGEDAGPFAGFAAVLKADADKAARAVAVALACPNIGSQLVDNLNASMHVRALLTDLFLFDEALKTLSR